RGRFLRPVDGFDIYKLSDAQVRELSDETRFFNAPERQTGIGSDISIDKAAASLQFPGGYLFCTLHITGKHGSAKTKIGIIRYADGLLFIFRSHYRSYGTK